MHLFIHFSFPRQDWPPFDGEDNWFPAVSLHECASDGCMYMCLAVYEFRIMMDRQAESKEHKTVYTATPNISIHLPLMQLLRQREALGHFLTSQWILGDLSCGVRVQAPTPDERPSWYFCFFISVSSSFLLTSRLMSHFWLEMLFYRWWTR